MDVPWFGVVATRAFVRATRRIDGGPESRTVYGGIFDDIYDGQHGNWKLKIDNWKLVVGDAVVQLG